MRVILGSFFIGILSLCVACQTPRVQSTAVQSVLELKSTDLNNRVTQLCSDRLPESQVGYFLLDPKTQEVLSHSRENELFIPGSVSKIPTVIAALQILGANYRFNTDLVYQGKIQGDQLIGDLYLKGTGDPTLKIAHLMDLAEKLEQTGIREIRGNFYYDESEFISQDVIEKNREPWAGFNSSVSALSLEFNQFMAYWRPAQDLLGTEIFSVPSLSWVRFSLGKHLRTTQTVFRYHSDQNVDHWVISPDSGTEGKVRLPVKHAGLTTASVFAELCQLHHIRLPVPRSGHLIQKSWHQGQRRGHQQDQIIARHESLPLIDLIESTLEYSNNLMAELVNLAAARQLVHRPVSVSEATTLTQKWLQKKMNPNQMFTSHLVNASGLSSENRMSPRQLASYLVFADRVGTGQSRSFENLLSMSGKKGDLESRLMEPGIAFHVWAKTGSMDFTNAIAGYLYTSHGRRLVFSMMTIERTERALKDELEEESHEPASQAMLDRSKVWTQKAKRTQDQIIMNWIQKY